MIAQGDQAQVSKRFCGLSNAAAFRGQRFTGHLWMGVKGYSEHYTTSSARTVRTRGGESAAPPSTHMSESAGAGHADRLTMSNASTLLSAAGDVR